MTAHIRPARQHRVEVIDILRPGALLGTEDGTGTVLAHQRVIDIAGDFDPQAIQPRVETGVVHGCKRPERPRRCPDDTALMIEESNAELRQHAGASVVGRRAADSQKKMIGAGVEHSADHPAHTPGVRVQDITRMPGNQLEPRGRSHLEYRRATTHRQTTCDRAPQGVNGVDPAHLSPQSRGHRIGESLAAVGHGHFDDLGIRNDGAHAASHGGRRLSSRHGLLERVRGEDDLHLTQPSRMSSHLES